MAITSINITVHLGGTDGTSFGLKTIPPEGVAVIQRWMVTQFKPNPADPSGPMICAYANSAESTEAEMLENFFNDLVLGRLAELASAVPSENVKAAMNEIHKASINLEVVKKKEVGLL